MVTSTICPVCRAPTDPTAAGCDGCGLIFATLGQPVPSSATGNLLRLAAGTRLNQQRYTLQRPLSQGGMGALYLATDHGAFERTVVIKALLDPPTGDLDERLSLRERFIEEGRTLAALRHPFIPSIFGYFQEGPACYIVMEYVEGRDLERGLTHTDAEGTLVSGAAYPSGDVTRWGIALCRVLEYLAAQQPHPVRHQDIKPANLVRCSQSNELFLVDFGTAQVRPTTRSGGYGTPGYAPPEQYRNQGEPRSDVYALAATLYHLATDDDPGAHPFSFPRLASLGPLGTVLQPALQREPARRPHAQELRRQLEQLTAEQPAQSLLRVPSVPTMALPQAPLQPAAAPPSKAHKASMAIGGMLLVLYLLSQVLGFVGSLISPISFQPDSPITIDPPIMIATATALPTPLPMPTTIVSYPLPVGLSSAQQKEYYYQLAQSAYAAKEWQQMALHLDQLLTLDGDYKDTRWLLKESRYHPAKLAFESGQWLEASVYLETLMALDADYLDAWFLYGQTLAHMAEDALLVRDLLAARYCIEQLEQHNSRYPDLPRLRLALAEALK